jgi:hypothetical protein
MAGGSDIHTARSDGKVCFATWFYNVGDLSVNVMYALPGEHRQGLESAWHPRVGAKQLRFIRFQGAT